MTEQDAAAWKGRLLAAKEEDRPAIYKEWLLAAGEEDRPAILAEFVETVRQKLLHAARRELNRTRVLRHDEESCDVVQSAYNEALRRLPKYLALSTTWDLFRWLEWVAQKAVIGNHREKKIGTKKRDRRREEPLADGSDSRPGAPPMSREASPSAVARGNETREVLLGVLERMSPADREILELAWLEGKGPAEIATVLKITNNNASQRLGRARERFMKLCPDYLRGQEGARHD